jgi:hypothetical protein
MRAVLWERADRHDVASYPDAEWQILLPRNGVYSIGVATPEIHTGLDVLAWVNLASFFEDKEGGFLFRAPSSATQYNTPCYRPKLSFFLKHPTTPLSWYEMTFSLHHTNIALHLQ